jgi:carbon storage regulator
MLVLTRRNGQAIRIGTDIEVRVIRIEGDRVVLGFDAPREIPVFRSELLTEVAEEVQRAATERELVRALMPSLKTPPAAAKTPPG